MNNAGYPVNNAGYPVNNAGHPVNVDNSDPSGAGAPYGDRGSGGGAKPDDTRFDGIRPVDSPWDPANQQYR